MKLLTVIVNYRAPHHVLSALEALVPQLAALGDSQVWVVDNHSQDDSQSILGQGIAGLAPELRALCTLIEHPVNGGFGAGNNVALRRALASDDPPEFIYLLNPDAVPDPGAIERLMAFMDAHPLTGIAGSYIHDPDGTPHCSSFRFPSLWSELENGVRLGLLSRLLRERTVHQEVPAHSGPADWVSGASMMLRRLMLEQVGDFDESFFLYFEEMDLCRRAWEAGWQVQFVREASVGHVGSVTTGLGEQRRRPKFWFDSRKHYLRKHHGPTYLMAANALWAAGFASNRARWLVQRKGPFREPHLLQDFLVHNFKTNRRSG